MLKRLVVLLVLLLFGDCLELDSMLSMPLDELDDLFRAGSADRIPLGLSQGRVIQLFLPPSDPRVVFFANPAWQGNFYQKTRCNGQDTFIMFTLVRAENIVPASVFNQLIGTKPTNRLQTNAAIARLSLGTISEFGISEFQLDDRQSIIIDFDLTQADCADNNRNEVRMANFNTVQPLNQLRTEMRKVGEDSMGRFVYLARVFAIRNNGQGERAMYEGLLLENTSLNYSI